jgi:hypothetical protein
MRTVYSTAELGKKRKIWHRAERAVEIWAKVGDA